MLMSFSSLFYIGRIYIYNAKICIWNSNSWVETLKQSSTSVAGGVDSQLR